MPTFPTVPAPVATLLQPRVLSAYGALIIAATLTVLYLYRGRAFIVYWIGAWLFAASALGLISNADENSRLTSVLIGLAAALIVWAAGLVLLAARAFPSAALRWTGAVRFAASSAMWFLAGPFLVTPPTIVATALLTGLALLGMAAFQYLRLSRRGRYAGAFVVGAGLVVLGITSTGSALALLDVFSRTLVNRMVALNGVTGIFVALGMHLLVFEDMTVELRRTNRDLASANEEVRRLAITDSLTGCFNRRFFDDIERRELQRHLRYGTPLAVVFIDVDRFKWLNDSLGHERGDEVLRAIGTMLRARVRESDYVIRWGGDEFLLLLTCSAEQAERKAIELKAAFRADAVAGNLPKEVALSTGVAAVSAGVDSLSDAINRADARMYGAKPRRRT